MPPRDTIEAIWKLPAERFPNILYEEDAEYEARRSTVVHRSLAAVITPSMHPLSPATMAPCSTPRHSVYKLSWLPPWLPPGVE
ncbi:hypothetical protein P8C59_004711 [Phyllachora maydis]|uniref:Uncharacterized protein n=1 Tax=Phyllachora maydis TaxID=1825666 RepID=A0AAD9I389_9PEZI|nr:hypothetical protein P8C59_004711 [Phyllachora maydis]